MQPNRMMPPPPLSASPNLPLGGKTVLLVHPAWHSCGSHRVFVCQARAYRSLGAQVLSLAIADSPGAIDGSRACKAYFAATGDLEADIRGFSGMPLRKILTVGFIRAAKQWLHGNYAATWLAAARNAAIPQAIAFAPRLDIIHCNHFFCMPVADRLRAQHRSPVLLDTHDLQARHYALRNRAGCWVPPVASYEKMLKIELETARRADLLIHLNSEEAVEFQELLPEKRHALLYPAVEAMPAGKGGGEAIIVASAHYPNLLDLRWFLQEVLPLVPDIPVKIYGNIDGLFRLRAPLLFQRHARLFQGRVETGRLRDAYRHASVVLLPATAGHGISIKTIEALSCGAPLIATPLAFRGFSPGAADLPNVAIVEDAAGFAAVLRSAYERRHLPEPDRASSPTRQFYQRHFAFDAYCNSLREIAVTLSAKADACVQEDI
jgi:polysaccharide biosynthesis protein PslH